MSYDDNKKRVLQQDEIGAALSSKRAALGMSENAHAVAAKTHAPVDEPLYFKLLCPQAMTGIIIGKGGAQMNHLNATTGAKIKLSHNGEFFPGTSDRVLLLCGDRDGLANALRELVTKIAEAAEKKGEANFDRNHVPPNRGPDGSFQIRLLIPRLAAGVLIGKGGAIIKQMIERSQCKMQMGEEADPFNTSERMFILNAASTNSLALGAIEAMNVLHSQPKFRTYANPTASYSTGATGGAGSLDPPTGRGPPPPTPYAHSFPLGTGAVAGPLGIPPVPGVVYTTAPAGAFPPPYPAAAYTISTVGGSGAQQSSAPAGQNSRPAPQQQTHNQHQYHQQQQHQHQQHMQQQAQHFSNAKTSGAVHTSSNMKTGGTPFSPQASTSPSYSAQGYSSPAGTNLSSQQHIVPQPTQQPQGPGSTYPFPSAVTMMPQPLTPFPGMPVQGQPQVMQQPVYAGYSQGMAMPAMQPGFPVPAQGMMPMGSMGATAGVPAAAPGQYMMMPAPMMVAYPQPPYAAMDMQGNMGMSASMPQYAPQFSMQYTPQYTPQFHHPQAAQYMMYEQQLQMQGPGQGPGQTHQQGQGSAQVQGQVHGQAPAQFSHQGTSQHKPSGGR